MFVGSVQIISCLDSQSNFQMFTSYFPAAKLVKQRAPPTWWLHTGLRKFAQNILTNIWSLGPCRDPKLGQISLNLIYKSSMLWLYTGTLDLWTMDIFYACLMTSTIHQKMSIVNNSRPHFKSWGRKWCINPWLLLMYSWNLNFYYAK